ncbi:MAG TPA: class I SAM-dependent methyltransferase [Kofleriaceae bacterium]|nr:class I SAM-dependent methyltransferase [Kofleriaceae bacterium]
MATHTATSDPYLALDPVLRAEAAFADRDYAPHADQLAIDPGMFRRYVAPTDVSDWRQMSALLLGDVRGLELLDFACGIGEESVYFATLGARVTGIDISDVGIRSLQRRAAHHGLAIRALKMRVDPTELASESFDRVHGLGILHHAGIGPGLAEVHRLLRPGGIAVFLEPLGDSPPIEAAKRWLMEHVHALGHFDEVTEHERNLTWAEIDREVGRFESAWVYPYHLLYRLKRLVPDAWLPAIRRIDHAALALAPELRRYAGAVVLRVRK